jgi:hypothetical protein
VANLGDVRRNRTADDLCLLEAVVELATIPVHVPAARAFKHLHGRLPRPADMRRLRRSITRLVHDGLLQAAVSLDLVPTPDGRVAVELLRFRRSAGADVPESPVDDVHPISAAG